MQEQQKKKLLSPKLSPSSVPEKLYFTIGELSKLCEVKTHVLRYWEQEFSQLNPMKRKGNRRYYQRKDVFLVKKIKHLLYEQGFTIEGAKMQIAHAVDLPVNAPSLPTSTHHAEKMQHVLLALESLLVQLKA